MLILSFATYFRKLYKARDDRCFDEKPDREFAYTAPPRGTFALFRRKTFCKDRGIQEAYCNMRGISHETLRGDRPYWQEPDRYRYDDVTFKRSEKIEGWDYSRGQRGVHNMYYTLTPEGRTFRPTDPSDEGFSIPNLRQNLTRYNPQMWRREQVRRRSLKQQEDLDTQKKNTSSHTTTAIPASIIHLYDRPSYRNGYRIRFACPPPQKKKVFFEVGTAVATLNYYCRTAHFCAIRAP